MIKDSHFLVESAHVTVEAHYKNYIFAETSVMQSDSQILKQADHNNGGLSLIRYFSNLSFKEWPQKGLQHDL